MKAQIKKEQILFETCTEKAKKEEEIKWLFIRSLEALHLNVDMSSIHSIWEKTLHIALTQK
jgi:hypothetical protein